MGIPSRREATHDVDANTMRLERRGESECDTERKLDLAMQSQLMREAGQAFVPA